MEELRGEAGVEAEGKGKRSQGEQAQNRSIVSYCATTTKAEG